MEGLRQPNIVSTMGQLGVLIDFQVASRQFNLECVWRAKIRKLALREQPTSSISRQSSLVKYQQEI